MSTVKTYTARRRLKVGEDYREPGQPYPEGHLVRRIDSWVHSGYVLETEVDEDVFRTWLERYVPAEQHADVLQRVGLDPSVMNSGPHGTPTALPGVKVPILPKDKDPDTREQGPVRKPRKRLPTKRVSPKKAAAKEPTADGEPPAEVATERTSGRQPLVVPLRALEDETSLLDEE